eukprot:gene28670-31847_t
MRSKGGPDPPGPPQGAADGPAPSPRKAGQGPPSAAPRPPGAPKAGQGPLGIKKRARAPKKAPGGPTDKSDVVHIGTEAEGEAGPSTAGPSAARINKGDQSDVVHIDSEAGGEAGPSTAGPSAARVNKGGKQKQSKGRRGGTGRGKSGVSREPPTEDMVFRLFNQFAPNKKGYITRQAVVEKMLERGMGADEEMVSLVVRMRTNTVIE